MPHVSPRGPAPSAPAANQPRAGARTSGRAGCAGLTVPSSPWHCVRARRDLHARHRHGTYHHPRAHTTHRPIVSIPHILTPFLPLSTGMGLPRPRRVLRTVLWPAGVGVTVWLTWARHPRWGAADTNATCAPPPSPSFWNPQTDSG